MPKKTAVRKVLRCTSHEKIKHGNLQESLKIYCRVNKLALGYIRCSFIGVTMVKSWVRVHFGQILLCLDNIVIL